MTCDTRGCRGSAEAGMLLHELQVFAGHANVATTSRYLNAKREQMAESLRRARERMALSA